MMPMHGERSGCGRSKYCGAVGRLMLAALGRAGEGVRELGL